MMYSNTKALFASLEGKGEGKALKKRNKEIEGMKNFERRGI